MKRETQPKLRRAKSSDHRRNGYGGPQAEYEPHCLKTCLYLHRWPCCLHLDLRSTAKMGMWITQTALMASIPREAAHVAAKYAI